jgi:cyclophilin family peptidyl-prolyl cis-trans isomerase
LKLIHAAVLAAFVFVSSLANPVAFAQANDPENTILLDVRGGQVVIRLRPDLAPNHVKRIKRLAREKFYDGLKFHRVLDGFMAQTGDPLGNGTGGSDYPDLKAEFSSAHFTRGVAGMARSADPDSANSQFFIMYGKADWLDGQYTIWGEVVSGMEYLDALKKGDPDNNGMVADPDTIIRMRVAADVQ